MFPFMILSTLAFGVCLGRIWDALHAKWKAEEDWATQQRVAARIEAIQAGTKWPTEITREGRKVA